MGDALPFVDLGYGRTVSSIASGSYFTCALMADNSVLKCWGSNSKGQLGIGDKFPRGNSPDEMGEGLAEINLGTGRSVKQVFAGAGSHACAILDDNTLRCWGDNQYGQLGLGDTSNRGDDAGEMGYALGPVDLGNGVVAESLALGQSHTCALVAGSGQVKCWGYNQFGQLGYGDTTSRGDAAGEMGVNLTSVDLGGVGRYAKKIACGPHHTCALLDNDQVYAKKLML
jgi:alpha-tubulin suppressor-like RCC1 family protein